MPHETIFKMPSRTKQEFKKSCDINHIIKRYQDTGVHPSMFTTIKNGGISASVDQNMSYHSMFQKVESIREEFNTLPSGVRRKFQNDPLQLLEFVSKEENREEAIKIGLLDAPKINETVKAIDALHETVKSAQKLPDGAKQPLK